MARTMVGLDIGSSAVRAVALSTGRAPSLVSGGEVPLPPGAVEAGSVKSARQVTEAIRTLWHDQRLKTKDVRIGVGSGSVLVRQLELDWMPPADLKKALRFQVADLLPVSVDDANIDHLTLDEYERMDDDLGAPRRFVKILLVATARGAVDEMVRAVQAAGLRPHVADLSALALVRAAARAGARDGSLADGTPEAIIDVGADKIAVAVHSGGRPHFVRVIAGVGGSLLTQALVDRSGRPWAEAEELKRTCRLPARVPAGAPDPQAGRQLGQEELVGRLVLDGARQLAAEVRATLDFHTAAHPEHTPERVLLTGGGADLIGLDELVGMALDLPTQRFVPADVLPRLVSRRGERDPLADDPGMLVPLGLALAGTA
ncbi:type IV pilus assembly protein PilM [Nocardioides sp. YIM 152588]|uniref:type IV pilus assembly protein PilM n=1 Tax=Nocardioides sp. YIM 152588 TaxID=3158259 RepID=UPI0032E3AB61